MKKKKKTFKKNIKKSFKESKKAVFKGGLLGELKQLVGESEQIRKGKLFTIAFLIFVLAPFSVFAGDETIASNTCTPTEFFSVGDISSSTYGVWLYIDYIDIDGSDVDYAEFYLKKTGNPSATLKAYIYHLNESTGNYDTLLYTSTNTITESDVSTGGGAVRFLFDSATIPEADDIGIVLIATGSFGAGESYLIGSGCNDGNTPNGFDDMCKWDNSAFSDQYNSEYLLLGKTTEVVCEEHGALGIFCPPVQNTATAFAGLFSTAIVFTVLNLWPYLLGVIIIIFAYKYGRRLLRL